jgi:hypothetical protein
LQVAHVQRIVGEDRHDAAVIVFQRT